MHTRPGTFDRKPPVPTFVVGGSSLTPLSSCHRENTQALTRSMPFHKQEQLTIGPFVLESHGALSSEDLARILKGFNLLPKYEKFFDDPSIGLYSCLAPLREQIRNVPGTDLGLYVNLGPANAKLDDFQRWGAENPEHGVEAYSTLMASSVVKLLPNVVMSNLSIHLDILGENTTTAGTSAGSAWCIRSARRLLREAGQTAVFVATASFPYAYFNLDSFRRFFADSFFDPPLIEGSAAITLTHASGVSRFPAGVLGSLHRSHTFRLNPEASLQEELDRLGFGDAARNHLLIQPSPSGNFLAAGEPLGILTVLEALNETGKGGTGISVTQDPFGWVSIVEVEGSDAARETLGRNLHNGHCGP